MGSPPINVSSLLATDDSGTVWGNLSNFINSIQIANWETLAVLIVLALLIIFWTFRRARKHKRFWYLFPLPLILLPLVLIAAWAINNHFGAYNRIGDIFDDYPFPTGDVSQMKNPEGTHNEGLGVETEIPGTISGVGSYGALIWLPPQYFSEPKGTKFPVIYLYHGTPGDYTQWPLGGGAIPISLANAEAGRPAIVVSATVTGSEFADTECVNGAQGNWSTYIAQDVPNYIQQNGFAIAGAQGNAAAGLSMGGYCAQAVALMHPESFGYYGNFSGSTMPTYSSMSSLFGPVPNLQQTVDTYTSDWIIANQPASHTAKGQLIIGNDDDESLISDQQQFAQKATALKMTAEFSELPGTHSFYVWTPALQNWMPWALGQMAKPMPPAPVPPAPKAPAPPAVLPPLRKP